MDAANLTTLAWDLEQRIRLAAPHYTELLRELVRVDTGPSCVVGIREAGSMIAGRLAHSGFSFEMLPVPNGEPAPWLGVQARSGGRPGGALLVGRLDTPWPGGTAQSWPFLVRHGVASGPGVGEMKGGLVTAIAAIEALDAAQLAGPEMVVLLLVSDGELSADARALVRDASQMTDWAASLESEDGEAPAGPRAANPTGAEAHLYSFAATVAAELGIEEFAAPSPAPLAVAAAASTAGVPVLSNAGPVASGRRTRDESIHVESLIARAALLATLLAAYDPRSESEPSGVATHG